MEEDVKKAIEEIRPFLKADGGDVEFVSLEGDVVNVKLKGACGGCPMATQTLKNGIERVIKSRAPSATAVKAV